MRKLISLLLMVTLCIILAACGNQKETENQLVNDKMADDSAVDGTVAIEEIAGNDIQAVEDTIAEESESEPETEIAESAEGTEAGNTIAVVYFSATGNTKAIAEHLADGLQADLYEIVPEDPYTDEDLNYNDNSSRSTIEMNDSSARPAISGTISNFDQYDIVFLGYPIWWGEAPRILDTFVESYDFTDKTVVPFCTSASSGIGSSAEQLESLSGSGNWMAGQRFKGNESKGEVMEWAGQY